MNLLRDIQNAAIDNSTSLETLLRKCRVLASRLKNDALKNWVLYELNGYGNAELPPYRQTSGHCFGNFSGPFGSALKSHPIPEATIPKAHKATLTRIAVSQGVAALELLLADNKDGDGEFMIPWDANASIIFGDKIYQGYQLRSAWTSVPSSFIAGVISTIRNRVLDFVLEIEAENPDAGEAAPDTMPIPSEQVTQIVNNHIYGNVGNLAAGQSFSQSSTATIVQGDFHTLEGALRSHEIDESDLAEIKNAIDQEPEVKGQNFGPKVAAWIGKMVSKAADGTWKVGTTVAGTLLASYLKQYYGLP